MTKRSRRGSQARAMPSRAGGGFRLAFTHPRLSSVAILAIPVAAASILARAEFLLRLKRLSDEVGTTLPKGASATVELAARMVMKKHGQERLGTVAKLHFKTTQAVLAGLA